MNSFFKFLESPAWDKILLAGLIAIAVGMTIFVIPTWLPPPECNIFWCASSI